MRVALLYPEVLDLARFKEGRKEFPPFGVLYLASRLEAELYDVDLIPVSDPQLVDARIYLADVVGISISASATINLLRSYLTRAQLPPDLPLLLGGVHCLFYAELAMQEFPEAIAAAYCEADDTIAELVRAAQRGDVSSVPGLVVRSSRGDLHRTPPPATSPDLADLRLPARHLLPREDVLMHDRLPAVGVTPMAHVMFSRGCPFPCAFCAAGKTEIRYRSGASAREELLALVSDYEIAGFAIVDDNFIVRRSSVSEICRAISDLGLHWSALSRVDTVNSSLLDELYTAGCVELKYGIESGSERILRAMKKNTTQDRIRRTVEATKSRGINVKAFIIHGFPGEDMASTLETIALLERLKEEISRISLFRFVPLPGTDAYDNAFEYGIRYTHRDRQRWDGDWSRFHIHHNDQHWWGSDDQFEEMSAGYELLRDYIEATFAT